MNRRGYTAAAALLLISSGTLAQTGTRDQDQRSRQDSRTNDTMNRRSGLAPLDWLLGARVLGQDRERLGEVNDLLAARDRVQFALLEHGGLLGMGERITPVPWRSLEWDGVNHTLMLPISTDRLSSAPAINKNEWKRVSEADMRRRTNEFFQAGGAQGRAADEGAGKWQTAVRNGTPTTIRGTIRDIDTSEPMNGMGPDRVIVLATEDGDQTVVHIGPSWFVDRQRQMFRQGQQVEVSGTKVSLDNDRSVVVAKTLNTPSGRYRLREDSGKPVWEVNDGGKATADGGVRESGDRDAMNPARERGLVSRPERDVAGFDNADASPTFKVSSLKNQRVTTSEGEDFGRLNTVVVDPETGKLVYAVVTVGGFLGVGDTKYAVPWRYFDVDSDGRIAARQLDRDKLRSAPVVESRNWTELQDEDFARRVYEHFGLSPAWRDSTRSDTTTRIRTEPGDRTTITERPATTERIATQPRTFKAGPDEFQQLFPDGDPVELTGTVSRLDYGGFGNMVDLIVQGPQDDRVVKLAPAAFVDKLGLNLQEGQPVTVRGRRVTSRGQQVIVAQDISVNGRSVPLRDDQGSPVWRTPR